MGRLFHNKFLIKHFPLFMEWGRSLMGDECRKYRLEIEKYYTQQPPDPSDKDLIDALDYMKTKGLYVFCYSFIEKYSFMPVKVYTDDSCCMKYVLHRGRKLYFKRGLSDNQIISMYRFLLTEQDEFSPHRYLTPNFDINPNDTLLDIGAAEGILTLTVIDRIREAYLFEMEEGWIEPLSKTFEPWKDKVKIIPKYVSNEDSESTIKIDTFIKNVDVKSLFVKIDVEGAEKCVLEGAEETLQSSGYSVRLAICTYHKQQDYEELSAIMLKKNYDVETSKGYMLFYFAPMQPPYFRRGMIYCTPKVLQ